MRVFNSSTFLSAHVSCCSHQWRKFPTVCPSAGMLVRSSGERSFFCLYRLLYILPIEASVMDPQRIKRGLLGRSPGKLFHSGFSVAVTKEVVMSRQMRR
jgi:hypothetical protein